MESNQIEEMTYIIQNTWLPIMRGQDTVGETHIGERDAIRIATKLIEANYVKQQEGGWVLEREPNGKPYFFHCSICDKETKVGTAFCPNCGAKMTKEVAKDE
jgi:hypothetical protein